MKLRAGHTDAWEKKELPVMEGNPGVLIEDAASELRQTEWGDVVREWEDRHVGERRIWINKEQR